ncbi:prolactin receptor a [Hemiscyllium ocellatum]|uniref:prolactin receptor a n=1 Tax=Hemiscyllium ocellatum TaxID=170820 RepID=UPI002965E9CB|nr:prolactin receptor a [Hemiscyllium ocellatum]
MSAPGKPRLTLCRSPDKETFTCWWEPGEDGGLVTNYSLWYSVEGEELGSECPDYSTMGPYSCFFNKNYTSIWTIYTITIIASNSVGRSKSEPGFIDVTYIVQPDPPVNVSLEMKRSGDQWCLSIQWSPPSVASAASGWMTLSYEVRLTTEELMEWEYFYVGLGTQFTTFSLWPDSAYLVEVHCKADHGVWSEWSPRSWITTPQAPGILAPGVWIAITTLSCLIGLALIAVFIMKIDRVRNYLVPAIPVPRIRGFDMKAGWSEGLLEGVCLHQCSVMPDIELECVDVVEVLSELVSDHPRPVLPVGGEMVQPMETVQDPQGGGCRDLASTHRNNPTAASHVHPNESSGRNLREGGVDGHGVVTGLTEKQQLPPSLWETVGDRAPEHSGTELAGRVEKPRSRDGQCPKAPSPWPLDRALAQYVSLSAGPCGLPLTLSSGESPASLSQDGEEMVTSAPEYSQVWNVGSG